MSLKKSYLCICAAHRACLVGPPPKVYCIKCCSQGKCSLCRRVQAYEAADAHLRRFHRSWCGLDALVSLGRFSCSGEALGELLKAKPPEAALMHDSELDG